LNDVFAILLKELEESDNGDIIRVSRMLSMMNRQRNDAREESRKQREKHYMELGKALDEVSGAVEALKKRMIGTNGDVENSLCFQVAELKKALERNARLNWVIIVAVVGFLVKEILSLI
jgi:hypothetical protein